MFYMLVKEIMVYLLKICLKHIDLGGYYNNSQQISKLIYIGTNLDKITSQRISNKLIILMILINFNTMLKKEKIKKKTLKIKVDLKADRI